MHIPALVLFFIVLVEVGQIVIYLMELFHHTVALPSFQLIWMSWLSEYQHYLGKYAHRPIAQLEQELN